MNNSTRALIPYTLCTTLVLLSTPALAHDGLHQVTYLQALLHELAHADYLPAAFGSGTLTVAAIWRLTRRKVSRNSCRKNPTAKCDGRRY